MDIGVVLPCQNILYSVKSWLPCTEWMNSFSYGCPSSLEVSAVQSARIQKTTEGSDADFNMTRSISQCLAIENIGIHFLSCFTR